MNADEIGWFDTVFKWLVFIVGTGYAAWGKWLMNGMSKNSENIRSVENLIRSHELEDARTYVSKQDFKETVIELKDTVKRVHEKMDEISRGFINLTNKP